MASQSLLRGARRSSFSAPSLPRSSSMPADLDLKHGEPDMNVPKVLLRSEQSGGEVAVIEGSTLPAVFAGPPLHLHDFDEAFYVLEGELTFRLSDELFTRRPASSATSRAWPPSARGSTRPSGPCSRSLTSRLSGRRSKRWECSDEQS